MSSNPEKPGFEIPQKELDQMEQDALRMLGFGMYQADPGNEALIKDLCVFMHQLYRQRLESARAAREAKSKRLEVPQMIEVAYTALPLDVQDVYRDIALKAVRAYAAGKK